MMTLTEQLQDVLSDQTSTTAKLAKQQGRLYDEMRKQGLVEDEGYHLVIHPQKDVTEHWLVR